MDMDISNFDELWDYDNPRETGQKFSALLPQTEKLKDKSVYIELLTQLARTQALQRKFDEAHETLDKAMKLIKAEHIRPRIRYMLERGRVYNSSGITDKAKEIFLAAFQQAEKYNEDYYAIDALHMLGIVYKKEDSLKWNLQAIKTAEKSKDEKAKKWLGSLYNNTGWTYHDMKEYGKALQMFNKNLEWHTSRDSKAAIIFPKWTVARALRSLGKIKESLKMQLSLLKEINDKKLANDGYVFEEIGECLLLQNKTAESKPYFKKAHEHLSKDIWLQANEKDRLDRLKKLSS